MRKKLTEVWICNCEDEDGNIHETEKAARNCRSCGPRRAYLCPICSEPKLDYDAAIRCHEGEN